MRSGLQEQEKCSQHHIRLDQIRRAFTLKQNSGNKKNHSKPSVPRFASRHRKSRKCHSDGFVAVELVCVELMGLTVMARTIGGAYKRSVVGSQADGGFGGPRLQSVMALKIHPKG